MKKTKKISKEGLEILQKVVNRIPGYNAFGCYDREDIQQEAMIMGIEVWEKWDGVRPWENFVAVHISNRLKSLKRDKYYRLGLSDGVREDNNVAKRDLMDTSPEGDEPFRPDTTFEDMSATDAVNLVLDSLPSHLRSDFQRMANGVTISKPRQRLVEEAVKGILGDTW